MPISRRVLQKYHAVFVLENFATHPLVLEELDPDFVEKWRAQKATANTEHEGMRMPNQGRCGFQPRLQHYPNEFLNFIQFVLRTRRNLS